MILTGNELAAASSAVAAIGILGGYLGVRSANHNALKIAREERSTRRRNELDDLRRATYARFLAALTSLSVASLGLEAKTEAGIRGNDLIAAAKKREDAFVAAHDIAAELGLLTPGFLHELVDEALEKAHTCKRESRSQFSSKLSDLRVAMRRDLQTSEVSNYKELDSAAHAKIGTLAQRAEIKDHSVEESGPVKAETSDNSNSSALPVARSNGRRMRAARWRPREYRGLRRWPQCSSR
jgi:hypothetical protein